MQTQGQVVEIALPVGGTCRCGSAVSPMTKVQFWRSAYGPAHDQIISCPTCERPKEPVPERMWLMKHRAVLKNLRFGYTYGSTMGPGGTINPAQMPPELEAAWYQVEADLEANWRRINVILTKLLDKLPRCDECSDYATHGVKNGPAYCAAHAKEHPTAQELAWAKELQELGVVQGV